MKTKKLIAVLILGSALVFTYNRLSSVPSASHTSEVVPTVHAERESPAVQVSVSKPVAKVEQNLETQVTPVNTHTLTQKETVDEPVGGDQSEGFENVRPLSEAEAKAKGLPDLATLTQRIEDAEATESRVPDLAE